MKVSVDPARMKGAAQLAAQRAVPVGRVLAPIVAVLGVLAFLLLVVFPTRAFLDQRDAKTAASTRLAVLSSETERLEARVRELQTDAEIERLAREQYNLVKPGEEAYAVLPAPPPPADVRVLVKVLNAAVYWDGRRS